MSSRFAETEARVRDAARVREIRAAERMQVERKFEPIRKRAAKNAEKMNNIRGYLAPW
jgi:hypothetical protein